MGEEVLKALANPTNQAILGLLAVEPTYPRRVSDLLSIGETDVSRRLKHMQGLGLVASEWRHIGKNVKIYKLIPEAVTLRFTAEGLRIEMDQGSGEPTRSALLDHLRVRIPAIEGFVGREDELEVLRDGPPVTVVEGLPGIGKSSLVAAFAQERQDDVPVFFHAFRGTESLTWLTNRLAVFAARHGQRDLLEAVEAGAEAADLHQLLLAALDREDRVVVLDDVHLVEDDRLQAFLRDAIEQLRNGKLVVAGRQRPRFDPAADSVTLLRLEGMEDDDVARFLEAKGLVLDPGLLPRVRAEVGGHPLALNLLVETAEGLGVPIEELLDRIPEQDLETYLLQEVHEQLSDTERAVLAHASIFRGRFGVSELSAVYPRDPTGALIKLRQRRLVEETGEAYQLHEVLANFFRGQLDDAAEVHERAAQHYLTRGTLEARLEGMHHLLAAGRRSRVLSLLEEDLDLEDFDVIDVGYHNLYLSILDLFDEDEIGDPRRAALLHDEKGDIRYHRDEYDQALAHYTAAGPLFEEARMTERLADLAWKRALCLQALDRAEEASQEVEAGLEHAPDEGLARRRLQELAGQLAKQ